MTDCCICGEEYDDPDRAEACERKHLRGAEEELQEAEDHLRNVERDVRYARRKREAQSVSAEPGGA